MKTLLLFLCVLSLTCCRSQTQGNEPIPMTFEGIWTNEAGTDTLTITPEKITWENVTDGATFVSYVDYHVHNDAAVFSFYAYPNVYLLRLEKRSRVKLLFSAQTLEGYSRTDGLYLKQTRSKSKIKKAKK